MESNTYAIRWGNDIKQEKTGIKMMNNLKKTVLGVGIALTTMFAANKDAVSQDIVASNSNASAKTSLTSNFSATEKEPKKSAAIIKEGHGGDASFYSLKNENIFVLWISGGTKGINGEPQEAYTAKQYAELLQKEFAKYGEDIAVFYIESDKDHPTGLQIIKDGRTYDRTDGVFRHTPQKSIYHPFVLYHDIPKIIASQKPSAPSVALN
jgi:hypothetical protein